MDKSGYRLINRENRDRHTQRHAWRLKATTTIAAVVLGSIWSGPAQAQFASGYFEWTAYYNHCCGYYPLVPGGGENGTVGVNQANRYSGFSLGGTRIEVYGGTTASRNSVSLALGASGFAWEPWRAGMSGAAFVANSDLITVNSNSLAAGTPIDVRLHLYATHPSSADIPVTGSILGYDFELNQSQTTFFRQVVVPGFLTIGGSRSVGALINRVAVGKNLRHDESYSANTSALAFFAIEILTPGATIPNHEFNEAERQRLEGLDSTRPSAPAAEDVSNDGRRQIIGVDREVIGSARHHHTTEPNTGAQRLQSRSASASADAGPTGYEYRILSGPSFISILLPELGDGLYDVSMWGDSGWEDIGMGLSANTIIDLTKHGKSVGTRGIRVTGIEPGSTPAGIGFVSGLTFSETGRVQWTQSSLPVPEPSTWALLLAGLAGLGVMAGRRTAAMRAAA